MKDLTQQGYVRIGYSTGKAPTQTELKTLQANEAIARQQTQLQVSKQEISSQEQVSRLSGGVLPSVSAQGKPEESKSIFYNIPYLQSTEEKFKQTSFYKKAFPESNRFLIEQYGKRIEPYVNPYVSKYIFNPFLEFGEAGYQKIRQQPLVESATYGAWYAGGLGLKALGVGAKTIGATKVISKIPIPQAIKSSGKYIPKALAVAYTGSVAYRIGVSPEKAKIAGEIFAGEVLPMTLGIKSAEWTINKLPTKVKSIEFTPKTKVVQYEKGITRDINDIILKEPPITKGYLIGEAKVKTSKLLGIGAKETNVGATVSFIQTGKKAGTVLTDTTLYLAEPKGVKTLGVGKGIAKYITKGNKIEIAGLSKTVLSDKTIKNLIEGVYYPKLKVSKTTSIELKAGQKITPDIFYKAKGKLIGYNIYKQIGKEPAVVIGKEIIGTKLTQKGFEPISRIISQEQRLFPVIETAGIKTTKPRKEIEKVFNILGKPKVPKVESFKLDIQKPSKVSENFISFKMGQPSTILEPPKTIQKVKKVLPGAIVSKGIIDTQIRNLAFKSWYEPAYYQRTESMFIPLSLGKKQEYSISGITMKPSGIPQEYPQITTPIERKQLIKNISDTILKPKQKSASMILSAQQQFMPIIPIQKQKQTQIQITKQLTGQSEIQKTRQKRYYKDMFELPPYVPIVGGTTLPFIFPPFLSPSAEGVGARRVRARRITEYTPSYGALVFKIKGKPAKKTSMGFTGLELRKIPAGFNYGKTFKRIIKRKGKRRKG